MTDTVIEQTASVYSFCTSVRGAPPPPPSVNTGFSAPLPDVSLPPPGLLDSLLDKTETTLGAGLDLLPPVLGNPFRTALQNLPLMPLRVPYKYGKLSVIGVGPGIILRLLYLTSL